MQEEKIIYVWHEGWEKWTFLDEDGDWDTERKYAKKFRNVQKAIKFARGNVGYLTYERIRITDAGGDLKTYEGVPPEPCKPRQDVRLNSWYDNIACW